VAYFSYSMKSVKLVQNNSIEPKLEIELIFKEYEKHEDIGFIDLVDVVGDLLILTGDGSWYELGIPNFVRAELSDSTIISVLSFRLSPYFLTKIEEFRKKDDLFFRFNHRYVRALIGDGKQIPRYSSIVCKIMEQAWKYSQSDWIKDLNQTNFGKTDLLELPKIILPEFEGTNEISNFIQKNRFMLPGW